MAIIKQAKNITIKINNQHTCHAGTIKETSEKVTIDATSKALSLNSNKKVISNGEQ